MSSFQEYGPLSERRKAELTQKRRKKIMLTGASFSALLVLAVVGVAASTYNDPDPKNTKATQVHSVSKSVTMICSTTDYKDTCEKSLNKAVGNSSVDPKPKDIVKAAVSVLFSEVGKVFSKAKAFKSDDPRVKGAVEVCNRLFKDAEDELQSTIDVIGRYKIEDLPKKSYLLRTWLSAVMSYQVTCVDAFPEGELKKKMKDGMKVSKEMTSNALAILGKAMAFLADMKNAGLGLGQRRLLGEEEDDGPELHEDGSPSWLSERERRQLRGKATVDLTPNVTVAKDGSGQFNTINGALAAMPKVYEGRYSIYVKSGVYDEYVEVTNFMVNVTMFGDGSKKSIITGRKNYVDGTQTFMTASFAALGEGFTAIGLGFQNTAGPEKHQAVALRVQSDRAVFLNCRFDGFQDTLYAQTHRQYYRSCVITGTVDFIFGDASAIFQNCVIQVLRPLASQFNAVTAQGREDRQEVTGFVLHDCKIVADPTLQAVKADFKSYLGRPWKIASRTVIMESQIDDFIAPIGYMEWEGQSDFTQLYYAEYMNTGPGAGTAERIKWPGFKVITDRKEAMGFTVNSFLKGGEWIKKVNAPVHMTLYH